MLSHVWNNFNSVWQLVIVEMLIHGYTLYRSINLWHGSLLPLLCIANQVDQIFSFVSFSFDLKSSQISWQQIWEVKKTQTSQWTVFQRCIKKHSLSSSQTFFNKQFIERFVDYHNQFQAQPLRLNLFSLTLSNQFSLHFVSMPTKKNRQIFWGIKFCL